MPYAPRDFDEQLAVTLELLDRVTTKAEFFDTCADEVTRLTLTWGNSHWAEIVEAAEENPILARGLGSAAIPPERRPDAVRLLRRLGVDRDLSITIRVTKNGPMDDASYHLAKVTIDEEFPAAILESILGQIPEHLAFACEQEISRRRRGLSEGP